MSASTPKVQMKFRCDQDINQMLIGEDGKPFCEMCKKSLVDFRTKSLTEVLGYTKENSGCGIFKAEHVESDIIFAISFVNLKKYLAAICTFLVLEKGYSQSIKDSISIMQVDDTKNKTDEKVKNPYVKRGLVLKRAVHSPRKVSKYEYGVFFRRKFPCLSFRRAAPTRKIHGLWSN